MAATLVVWSTLLLAWQQVVAAVAPEDPRRVQPLGWRLPNETTNRPLYSHQDVDDAELWIVGDSRLFRGLYPEWFELKGHGETAILWGPAAQLLDLLPLVEDTPRRRVVVGLSPVSVYREFANDDPQPEPLRRQIDRQLESMVHELRVEHVRTLRTAPWMRGRWFYEPNELASDNTYRGQLRPVTRDPRMQRLERIENRLREIAKHHDLVCIRAPISQSLLVIEDASFDAGLFAAMCERIGVPYLDYTRTLDLATSDGSHLTREAARQFTERLESDLRALWN